ncbi:hypothetical protein AYL99_08227 [Fonsecaea erecta]|uniref:Uncharacterized protein n=1 Tax=Fonsecaea erecta TaxID=1367422 RepID=A0A178ZCK4_9EURO|nr:hypothetical protein AYL99_08227 [Fonsecaea erecta]OAP57489.1 hypothetical protein AYL99_08227 [Fonsecaea erecta]
MVKFRGIEICIISQFDICKLPEFQYRKQSRISDPFQPNFQHDDPASLPYPTAACFVPIYPGSQIWFEYTVDGPHPPEAAWFFKLFINGQVVTSWDCTAKHGFHGKMMYNLVNEGLDAETGHAVVRTEALRFGDGLEDCERGGAHEDMIQINVHRVEHKRRIWDLEAGLGQVNSVSDNADGLQLTNSGFLEPCIRPRRYKFQLLDPVDMPYAAFQFHCRSHGSAHDTTKEHSEEPSPFAILPGQSSTIISPIKIGNTTTTAERQTLDKIKASTSSVNVCLSDSDDSLSVRTKDSIEDLSSRFTRSPRSPRSPSRRDKSTDDERRKRDAEIPPSPSPSARSPRQRLRKKLTVNINGANFDVDRKRRPLSPFTSGGMLRKACVPQTAPASVTEFGPTVEEEIRPKLQKSKAETDAKPEKGGFRTTSEERGGKRLMGFLGRRIASGRSA